MDWELVLLDMGPPNEGFDLLLWGSNSYWAPWWAKIGVIQLLLFAFIVWCFKQAFFKPEKEEKKK